MTFNLRTLRLFLFGCLIGAVGMLVYGNTEAMKNWFSYADVSTYAGTLASAQCTPEAEEDEIFFISCGGIY